MSENDENHAYKASAGRSYSKLSWAIGLTRCSLSGFVRRVYAAAGVVMLHSLCKIAGSARSDRRPFSSCLQTRSHWNWKKDVE